MEWRGGEGRGGERGGEWSGVEWSGRRPALHWRTRLDQRLRQAGEDKQKKQEQVESEEKSRRIKVLSRRGAPRPGALWRTVGGRRWQIATRNSSGGNA